MITSTPVYTIKGATGLTQRPDERGWDVMRGVYTQRAYEGPAAVVRARFTELVAQGVESGADEIRESYDGQHGTLLLRLYDDASGTSEQNAAAITTTWEARTAPVLKPIETHSAFVDVTAARKATILKAAREALGFSGTTAENLLYRYLSSQVTEYYEYAISLRKTVAATRRTLLRAVFTNINTVVTLASIGVPSGVLSELPTGWEWLYQGASVTAAGRQYQIVSEWMGAEKWAAIYGGTWTP